MPPIPLYYRGYLDLLLAQVKLRKLDAYCECAVGVAMHFRPVFVFRLYCQCKSDHLHLQRDASVGCCMYGPLNGSSTSDNRVASRACATNPSRGVASSTLNCASSIACNRIGLYSLRCSFSRGPGLKIPDDGIGSHLNN
jgi:hypothetical protein